MIERFEYDVESDTLDVLFGEKRSAWTIELTPNILLSIDRSRKIIVRLTFSDYTELVRPTLLGIRSFPITGFAQLPNVEREIVANVLNSVEVRRWLDVSTVQDLPDSPFVVTHLQPPPVELADKLFAIA